MMHTWKNLWNYWYSITEKGQGVPGSTSKTSISWRCHKQLQTNEFFPRYVNYMTGFPGSDVVTVIQQMSLANPVSEVQNNILTYPRSNYTAWMSQGCGICSAGLEMRKKIGQQMMMSWWDWKQASGLVNRMAFHYNHFSGLMFFFQSGWALQQIIVPPPFVRIFEWQRKKRLLLFPNKYISILKLLTYYSKLCICRSRKDSAIHQSFSFILVSEKIIPFQLFFLKGCYDKMAVYETCTHSTVCKIYFCSSFTIRLQSVH